MAESTDLYTSYMSPVEQMVCTDLRMVVGRLRNVAKNIPAAFDACSDCASMIEDVIRELEGKDGDV